MIKSNLVQVQRVLHFKAVLKQIWYKSKWLELLQAIVKLIHKSSKGHIYGKKNIKLGEIG